MPLSPTLSILLRLVIVLIAGIGFYKLFFANDSPTRNVIFINQELGMTGTVTGVNKARGYKIYLDSSDVPYNFDAFENPAMRPNNGLGYYLERGDLVEKKPSSTTITVDRGGQQSEWHFVKPTLPAR
ncbi:MAG: hypothetical protein M3Y54_15605 [Bacteroidota bacterium]|nr:hypothetical protein [Bacteroidota bacterium]